MVRTIALAALLAAGSAAAASAQDYGYRQIASGDLQAAEARLTSAQAADPTEPSVLINLAAIYAKTGREAQARALYEQVLAADNVVLEMGDRSPAWSHGLARRGLRQPAVLAAR